MFKDRSLISLLLFFPLLWLAGSLRPKPAPVVVLPIDSDAVRLSGAVGERFWTLKTHGTSRFDMILMGDSRVYRGLSPAAMESILTGTRILNFGYSGGGLDPVMYAAAERKLAPRSQHKSIVLGVTPLTLTAYAARNQHYLQELNRPADYVFLRLYWLPLVHGFEPLDINQLATPRPAASPQAQGGYYQEFHDDGWIASWTVPEDPYRTLPSFRDIFSQTPVRQDLVQQLLDQTRAWTSSGIRAYAFRVPSSPGMVALEDQLSGFDEAAFVAQFEAAGGIWFSIPLEPYHSYDGSHLTKPAALQLSLDLAKLIKDSIQLKAP